ncbi:MAG: aconitase X catalytic domain-containing protein [Candidatus Bathyarchaeia archaeon]
MHLTREEERIYDGELGWASQICMKILVKLGDLFGAERLIPIDSAHVSGVSYKTLGNAPIEFLKALAESGGKVRVESTLNPKSFDPEYLGGRLSEKLLQGQREILQAFEKMGFKQSYTCTPYYLRKVKVGAHLAWAESSAVIYANSVLGALTNREGGPSALAAAIIGKTPEYGIHKPENREPHVLVEVDPPIRYRIEYGALGIFLGRILKDKIPVIKGLEKRNRDKLKQLGAALASTGMTNMFYYETDKLHMKAELEKINVGRKEIENTIEELTTTHTKPDIVFIGCPHCSLLEVRKIAELARGKKVKHGTELWICTSQFIKEKAAAYISELERCGAKILSDTCAVVTWTEELGIKTIMTNSAKTADYAPTLNNANTILASLEECLKTAVEQ